MAMFGSGLFAQSRAVPSFPMEFILLSLQLAAASDFLHSPKLQPSQGIPGSAELLFSRSRTSRTFLQPSVELTSEQPALAAGEWGHRDVLCLPRQDRF